MPRARDAIVRVTLTTICGTDVHIWREEYPVAPGRIVGHEPVGAQRDGVLKVALTPQKPAKEKAASGAHVGATA